MQYHHRSRPPFGRGGGGGGSAGYPRGHRQLYAPAPLPPPFPAPPPPPPPQRRYEVLMEAGRLAAEYLVAKGVLPPSSLQRGGGGGGGGASWAAPLPPPPPPQHQQQQLEPPPFYGRRRYDDEYSNNPSTRPRRNSSSNGYNSSSRDDHSSGGSYSARVKRKYGEYRRGNSDVGRERGRSSSNGRRYEDEDDDGAPGFRRERRGSWGNGEARSSATERMREPTLSMKAVGEFEMEDTTKAVTSIDGVRKHVNALPDVQGENEEGEMEDSNATGSELEVVEQGIDSDDYVNASTGVSIEAEVNDFPDAKVLDKKAEDVDKVLGESASGHIALDSEMANLDNDVHNDRMNLLKYCDFAKAPTRPRSMRAYKNAASVQREMADLVSSGESSQMVVDKAANKGSLTNIKSDNREDQICQENIGSRAACNEIAEPILLEESIEENKTPVTSVRETKSDAQLHVVQEYKEGIDLSQLAATHKHNSLMQETDISPSTDSLNDGLMQEANQHLLENSHKDSLVEETNMSPKDSHKDSLIEETNLFPLTAPHKDSLIQEKDHSPMTTSQKDSYSHKDFIEGTDLSLLTASQNDSLMEETDLSQTDLSILTASQKGSLMEETDLSQTISSHEDNLEMQFKEEPQICDIDMLPQDVDLIELSDQSKIVGAELFPNAGAESIINMENEKMVQSNSICGLNMVSGPKVSVIHNNPGSGCSADGSSTELQKQQQEDFQTSAGENVSATDNLCQLPLDNKDVQVINIEDDTPIEVGDFDSSKAKNEMICSSMETVMHPGIHTDDLPDIQDGYNLAISDYLGADIPCYPSMQSDLQAGLCANDSEGIPTMDDPIYGSLSDIGFMDVWGQPTHDYDKFF